MRSVNKCSWFFVLSSLKLTLLQVELENASNQKLKSQVQSTKYKEQRTKNHLLRLKAHALPELSCIVDTTRCNHCLTSANVTNVVERIAVQNENISTFTGCNRSGIFIKFH